jgi:hypothetical protein
MLVLEQAQPGVGTVRVGGDLTDAATLGHRLWLTLLVLVVPSAFVAALLGSVLTRNGLRPVVRLTEIAEHIARTQDFNVPVEIPADGLAAR